MRKNIIAATDFSTRSQRALRRAGRLAKQTDAEFTLTHVVDDDQPQSWIEMERRESNTFLNEQMGSLIELRLCEPTAQHSRNFIRTLGSRWKAHEADPS